MNKKNISEVCANLYISDFETTTDNHNVVDGECKRTDVYIAGILSCYNDKIKYQYSIDEWFDDILKLPNAAVVYFHNLSFDGEFIIQYLLKKCDYLWVPGFINWTHRDLEITEQERKRKVTKLISVLQDASSKIYQITIDTKIDNTWKKIIFKCSYNITNMSLKNWAKNLGMKAQKLELDYRKYFLGDTSIRNDKELHKYLDNDLKIVKEGLVRLYMKVTKDGSQPGLFGLTSSSIAMNEFKFFMNNRDVSYNENCILEEKKEEEDEKKKRKKKDNNFNLLFNWINNGWSKKDHADITTFWYRGGYCNGKTSIIDKWVKCENAVYLDVNSLYPSVMKKYAVPYGKKLTKKDLKKYDIKDYYTFSLVNITKFVPKNSNCPELLKNILGGKLRIKHKLKNVRYLKKWDNEDPFIIGFIKEEIDFLREYVDLEYELLEEFYVAKTDILCDFISEVENEKINAKTAVDRQYAKLKQNSIYGKFGQKWARESYGYFESVKKSKLDVEYNERKNIYRRSFINEVNEVNISYPLVAAVITALSRIELQKIIMSNIDEWMYSDTDSCVFKKMPTNVEIDAKKYGAWKIEKELTEFKWIRAKCYATRDKKNNKYEFTVSGLPAEAIEQIDENNFKKGLELKGVKLAKKRIEGGIVLTNVDYTIKKDLINAEITEKTVDEKVKKKIKTMTDKEYATQELSKLLGKFY